MHPPEADGVQTVPLLEAAPDLREYFTREERELTSRVTITVFRLSARPLDVNRLLAEAGAFGGIILDGVVLHRLSIGDQPALRLLGPGDMLSPSGRFPAALLGESSFRTTGPIRLAMLDERVLLLARRFPRLFAGLQIRLADQHQRLAAQLVICQLPRVEDRLLALMWLLAESWGRVTPSGTVVPIALTHDALGELIGARRPTVTLALKELAERGALFRQDGEWLLLEPPPHATAVPAPRRDPYLNPQATTGWAATASLPDEEPRRDPTPVANLTSMILALQSSQASSRAETDARLERARQTREQTVLLRQRIRSQRLNRQRQPPARQPAP